jgi:Transposase DDE domain
MENRLLRFARLALAVARRAVPDRASRFAPGIFTQPQLFACLLLKEHLRLDYRTTEDLIATADRLRAILALRRAPDHTTLWWFARHRLTPGLVQTALAETVRRVDQESGSRRQVALDSTGLWLAYSSRCFRWRAKRERGQRGWLKWALALWTSPQLLLAQRVRLGPCGDFSDLVPLARAAHAVLPFDELLADAGYDSEANHRFCRERLKVRSLIPAKKRRSAAIVATTPYRREMGRLLGKPGHAASRQAYRQRWKAETVMSVTKRKWGEALSARTDCGQLRQALLRGLVYTLNRLVLLHVPA